MNKIAEVMALSLGDGCGGSLIFQVFFIFIVVLVIIYVDPLHEDLPSEVVPRDLLQFKI